MQDFRGLTVLYFYNRWWLVNFLGDDDSGLSEADLKALEE